MDGEQPPAEMVLAKMVDFAPTIRVSDPQGRTHHVASNPSANRALAQLTAARLRTMLWEVFKEMEGGERKPTPEELKIFATTAKVIEEIAADAYGSKRSGSSEFESFAIRAVKAAAAGVASSSRYEERRRRLSAVGRGAEQAKPVQEVVATVEPSS